MYSTLPKYSSEATYLNHLDPLFSMRMGEDPIRSN
jgi:hypothetical protein